MRIYMINDYGENGPVSIRVATTADGIRSAFETRLAEEWPASEAAEGYREEARAELARLLAADVPCSGDLGSGWGGLQLHILDTSD